MPKNASDVVIVGGGPTGSSIFIKFVDEAIEKGLKDVTITLIEKNGVIGPGLPFNTDQPEAVLMNTAVKGLNITLDDKHTFYAWLKKKDLAGDPAVKELGIDHTDVNKIAKRFVPRKLYGRYLQETLEEAINKARDNGIKVNVLKNSEIKVIERERDSWVLEVDNKSEKTTIVGNNLVLATGNMPSESYRQLGGKPNYFASPYEDLTKIDRTKPVVVLGSGLSAIDAAKLLVAQGHVGPIIFASGSGALPAVKPIPNSVEIVFENLTKKALNEPGLTLDKVIDLFNRDLEIILGEKVNFEDIMNAKQDPVKWLSKQIGQAEKNIVNKWQIFLDEMYYHVLPHVWKNLSDADLETFKRKYYGPYMKWAAGMPKVNAEQMLELIRKGQLQLVSGLRSVEHVQNQGFQVTLDNGASINTEYVINATGMGHIISDNPLLAQMQYKKYIASPKFGGILVDSKTYQVIDPENKQAYSNLFAAGPPIFGSNLAVYAVESSAMAADEISPVLVKKLIMEQQLQATDGNNIYPPGFSTFPTAFFSNANSPSTNNNNVVNTNDNNIPTGAPRG